MRKIIVSVALAGTALAFSACSETAEDADTAKTDTEAGDTMSASDMDEAELLNANDVTAIQLAEMSDIPSELAQAIVAGQPYDNVVDFNNVLVQSLSEEEAAAMRERIFVPIDLNDTTSEQIELVPGMTPQMVREFEEYAPYEDMAEFDREIGKYVDEDEVARLRQYVTL